MRLPKSTKQEMENQREQFQFEIRILRERVQGQELEKEGSTQGRPRWSEPVEELAQGLICRSDPVQKSPREESAQPSQTPPVKPKQQRMYATIAKAKAAQASTQP